MNKQRSVDFKQLEKKPTPNESVKNPGDPMAAIDSICYVEGQQPEVPRTDDVEMEFDKESKMTARDEQPIEEPQPKSKGIKRSISLFMESIKKTYMQGYIHQMEGDDDRQSFHSRMDRGTIVQPRIMELQDRSFKLFEAYRDRADSIGRDARLMSIALNKAHKRLSVRNINDRIGTQYKSGLRSTFLERRQTMKQSIK